MLLIIREVLENPKEECAQKGSMGNSNGYIHRTKK